MPKERNIVAVAAQFRTAAGPMKDRRAQRGGATNSFRSYMEEALDQQEINDALEELREYYYDCE